MATKQEQGDRRVYDTEEEANQYLKEFGKGKKVFPVWLPNKVLYVVCTSGHEALGYLVAEMGLFEVPVTGERQETVVRRHLERALERQADLKTKKRVKSI